MKLLFFTIILQILIIGCSNQRNQTYPPVFSKGSLAPSENFTGNAWVLPFVTADSIYTTVTGHVLFEAGARSNWHSHPSGQILIVTAGVGYHQVKGEPKQVIKKGDVVKCSPNAVHWHGASRDSSMSHIYLVPNTEKGVVDWMGPVSEEEFLKQKISCPSFTELNSSLVQQVLLVEIFYTILAQKLNL